jgi:hypothetical protein
MSKKDINTLIQLSRKLGKSICDEGTFEERRSKLHLMTWKYKGNEFEHRFPGALKTFSINRQVSQMRKSLRASGLKPPDELNSGFTGSDEHKEMLEELWCYLGTDDEGETPYGGDVDR